MNNFVLHNRTAATATVAAMFLAGHATHSQSSDADHNVPRSVVHFNFLQGSPGIVTTMTSGFFSEQQKDFAAAVGAAYQSLAQRQQRLDLGMARALAENAWDLYEEA
jgi:hypothetical protein